jgi:flagellar export protein FliJ
MLQAQRLQPIHELAERHEDAAAVALAEARKLLAAREAQLRELENYREPPVAAASAELLRNREAFRTRLSEAIRYQRQAIAEARKLVDARCQAWMKTHQQTKVYEQLLGRSRKHEQAQQDRRSQRELDELALRLMQARSFG